ncbi:MAG: Rid family detoxifying hydrolase [Planctomycetota bacterium]
MRFVQPLNGQSAIGPYSPGVACGGLLFVSGQVPRDAAGNIVAASIEAATAQALRNLGAVLAAAGCSSSNVVKTTVFLRDLGDFAGMNQAYAEFFGNHRPARSTVQVAKLPADARVEIDCIAVLD